MQSNTHHPNKAAYFNQYIECPDYKSLAAIVKSIPHLKSLQAQRNFDQVKCQGVIIRSGNDDNIHKAIKYGVWTTTHRNKHKLQKYWREYLDKKVHTYLFFSAVKSGHFEGVARLASGYNDETFPYWWENQHGKFKGHFDIQWIYIKDINYRHFEGLKNEVDEDFVKSKDCDDISEETTKKALEIFKNYTKNKSIFSSFSFFDTRQKDQLRSTYTQQQLWLLSRQYQQMQLQQQQYLYASMQPPNYFYGVQEVQIPIKQTIATGNGFTKVPAQTTTSNPGFQMNPVSRGGKRTQKDKDVK